jgi:hypothetical protein
MKKLKRNVVKLMNDPAYEYKLYGYFGLMVVFTSFI